MKNLYILTLLILTIIQCKSKDTPTLTPDPNPNPNPMTSVSDSNRLPRLISLNTEWRKMTNLWGKIPDWMEVYQRNTIDPLVYAVVFDPKAAKAAWNVATATAVKPLSSFWADETGTKYACINATFFGSPNQNFGLVIRDGALISPNIRSVSRTFNGASTAYYPTRAALGTDSTGKASVFWTYTPNGSNTTFAYPQPAPNQEGVAPVTVPSATFPTGGIAWNVTQAVGGSPMLLNNGTVNITDVAELSTASVVPTSSRPRSAIGYLPNGNIVIVALQGTNNTGMTLSNLAILMRDMGVTNAINLDGGGSTGLIVAGSVLIRSNDATERPIISAIMLKGK